MQEPQMYRRPGDLSHTRREWRAYYLYNVKEETYNRSWNNLELGRDTYAVRCRRPKGRFRKRDAWDCGKTRCQICHSDKYPKRDTTGQEYRSLLVLEEGKKELGGPE